MRKRKRTIADPSAGFSMIELILVMAISGMVVAGMVGLMGVTESAVHDQQTLASIDSADRPLTAIDRDLRFCGQVLVGDDHHVSIQLADGGTVTYAWDGVAGSPLTRDAGLGPVAILDQVVDLRFRTLLTEVPRPVVHSLDKVEVAIEPAAFSVFSLLPGFAMAELGGLVSLVSSLFSIDKNNQAGIGFVADLGAEPDATPQVLRCRLQRAGTSDLRITVYEADDLDEPGNKKVASGTLRNYDIPLSLAEVTIPLSAVGKLSHGDKYFVVMESQQAGSSAEIEYQTLSIPLAAASAASAFTKSTNKGKDFSFVSAVASAGQAKFTLEALAISGGAADSTPATESVTTAVEMTVTLQTADGPQVIVTSFPLLNNVARVGSR